MKPARTGKFCLRTRVQKRIAGSRGSCALKAGDWIESFDLTSEGIAASDRRVAVRVIARPRRFASRTNQRPHQKSPVASRAGAAHATSTADRRDVRRAAAGQVSALRQAGRERKRTSRHNFRRKFPPADLPPVRRAHRHVPPSRAAGCKDDTSLRPHACGSELPTGAVTDALLTILNKQLGIVARQERETAGDDVRALPGPRASARSNAQPVRCRQLTANCDRMFVVRRRLCDGCAWPVARPGCTPSSARVRPVTSSIQRPSQAPAEALLEPRLAGHAGARRGVCMTSSNGPFINNVLRHLQRRCQACRRRPWGTPAAFATRLCSDRLHWGVHVACAWRGHRLSGDRLAEQGLELACELETLAEAALRMNPIAAADTFSSMRCIGSGS